MLKFRTFFCLASKNTGICSALCISGLTSIGIYSIFFVFALTQKCCNLQHVVNFEKLKIVRKMCQNGSFFPILGTLKMEGLMLLETLMMSEPDSVQKALPHQWRAWGTPHHRALVALGCSWGKPLVRSRRSQALAEKRLEVSVGSMLRSCWGYVGDILDHPGLKGRLANMFHKDTPDTQHI